MTKLKSGFLLALLLFTVSLNAETKPVRWSAHVPTSTLHAGERFEIEVTASIDPDWHIYSITQPAGGPVPTSIAIAAGQPFQPNGPVKVRQPQIVFDPNFDMKTEIYDHDAEFTVPAIVSPGAKDHNYTGSIDVRYQACNETICMPVTTEHIPVVLAIMAVIPETAPKPRSSSGNIPASVISSGISVPQKPEDQLIFPVAPSLVSKQSLASFVWLAMVMGALSLVTPCVFPMIPITVSYFANHGGETRRCAVWSALIYCLGIILTFTAIGILLALVFGAGGVNQLAANPWVNLLITVIFLGFAFSLFGAYFIQVPSGLMNKLGAIASTKKTSAAIGALLIGFTFTLTSFTCTAPFVGTLLVMTAQGSWRWPLVGMLVFSTVFAFPFFLLALAPQLMSHLPKAGGWMVSIKVVMGFLEIAAAMKFLSNADMIWHWGIFTRQVVLAVWVGIGFLTVLYVLGYFRMAHDSPVDSVGAARITVAIIFLAATIWLIPGLFGRQLGELESFLPPEIGNSSPGGTQSTSYSSPLGDADWILNDYEGALVRAKQQNTLVFVDFTGYTCTNCRWMEANMFSRPEVAREMYKFVRLRLYTDGDGKLYERQQKLQQQKFGTVALPYYAIMRPDGSPVSTFPGLTRNASEFVAFLQQVKAQ